MVDRRDSKASRPATASRSVGPDLFAEPNGLGISLADEFLTHVEEAELIAEINRQDLSPFRFQGWLGKRLTASFGWNYDFDSAAFALAAPIPQWLEPIRCRAASFAGIERESLVQAMLIRYDPGAGIGWHRDRPVFDHVVGISLGAPATLRLRYRTNGTFRRFSVPLQPRSIYHLKGEARHNWEHSITPMDETRWSITFRSLSAQGEQRKDRRPDGQQAAWLPSPARG